MQLQELGALIHREQMHLKCFDRIQYNGNQRLLDAIEPTFLTGMKLKTHLSGSEESTICLSD